MPDDDKPKIDMERVHKACELQAESDQHMSFYKANRYSDLDIAFPHKMKAFSLSTRAAFEMIEAIPELKETFKAAHRPREAGGLDNDKWEQAVDGGDEAVKKLCNPPIG